MRVTSQRWVDLSDENGDRRAVVAEVMVEGDELVALLAADLSSATQPYAADSRLIARPLAAALQALPQT